MQISQNPYYIKNPLYFLELKELVEKYPLAYFNMLKAKFCKSLNKSLLYLKEWIDECTPKLSDNYYLISTKVNWILNGIVDFPRCEICNKQIYVVKNIQAFKQYNKYCNSCSRKLAIQKTKKTIDEHLKDDPLWYAKIDEKRKKTNLLLHGDPNWNNEHKTQQTCLDKYGVDNIRKTDFCKESIKKTKKDKYGDENYVNIEKAKSTNKDRRGVDWPMQDPDIRKKSASKYNYDGKMFDSKAELCYYVWLKDNDISFEYQPDMKFEYVFEGKTHFYHPDFLIENQYVEIKGDHFFKEDGTMQNPYDHSQDGLYEAKHQCMIQNNVKILNKDDYSFFVKYVIEKYGKNFLQFQCKYK